MVNIDDLQLSKELMNHGVERNWHGITIRVKRMHSREYWAALNQAFAAMRNGREGEVDWSKEEELHAQNVAMSEAVFVYVGDLEDENGPWPDTPEGRYRLLADPQLPDLRQDILSIGVERSNYQDRPATEAVGKS